ncbi:MAG TPA: ABC transporter ATP-binding protein [Chloroflexota bacterium]|nr:ABC transporter ATP-binding protein [Chloroflexota bacterium]
MRIDSEQGIRVRDVSAGYGGKTLLEGVDLRLPPGGSMAIVGPNGAGKTTLFRVITAMLKPRSGSVTLDGVDVRALSRRELSRLIAVVPQRLEVGFGLTAGEVVTLGRTPHMGFLRGLTDADRAAILRAVEETEIEHLVHRSFSSLSGGEQQRTVLAMAIAQEAPYLLLDEPTVHLDVGQQWRLMESLATLRTQRRVGILAIVHDLSLAGLYFEHVLVLDNGRVLGQGRPQDVLTAAAIGRTFGAPLTVRQGATGVSVLLNPGGDIHRA